MFKNFFVLFALFCPIITWAAPDAISPDTPVVSAFTKAFGSIPLNVGDTITLSTGGYGYLFLDAAKEVLKEGRHIKIDGPCRSSCVMFADKARPNVCITGNVMFSFHMGTNLETGERVPMPLSADIEEWVLKGGGLPYEGYLRMDPQQASAFWPMCK